MYTLNTALKLNKTTLNPFTPETQKKLRKQANLKHNKSTKVYGISNLDDIAIAKAYFLKTNKWMGGRALRDYTLFVLSINCARRIGDILSLTVSDVMNMRTGAIVDVVSFHEQKTSKYSDVYLSDTVKETLKEYFKANPEITRDKNNGLFPSRKSKGGNMTTVRAWQIFKDMANATGLQEKYRNIGTHSGRKTWAEHQYETGTPMTVISSCLNHSSEEHTRIYMGLDQEDIKQAYLKHTL